MSKIHIMFICILLFGVCGGSSGEEVTKKYISQDEISEHSNSVAKQADSDAPSLADIVGCWDSSGTANDVTYNIYFLIDNDGQCTFYFKDMYNKEESCYDIIFKQNIVDTGDGDFDIYVDGIYSGKLAISISHGKLVVDGIEYRKTTFVKEDFTRLLCGN